MGFVSLPAVSYRITALFPVTMNFIYNIPENGSLKSEKVTKFFPLQLMFIN
jgi:hypothetical protein